MMLEIALIFGILLAATVFAAENNGTNYLDDDNDEPSLPEGIPSILPRNGAPATCGRTKDLIPVSRIVGGKRAQEGEFPWQVSLQLQKGSSSRHFCGATVLNERWIITAAHCLRGQTLGNLRAVLGTNSLSKRSPNSETLAFDTMVIHGSYNSRTVENDIGLLRTSTVIPFFTRGSNSNINGVCLPYQGESFSGQGMITGFGSMSEGTSSSDNLMAAEVNLISDNYCSSKYGTYKKEAMMCAGFTYGGKDSCQGDSGGPLVQRGQETTKLVGVVSFGKGCARNGYPGVYTRVSNYVDWINQYTVQM